jgi:hypothetical protein
MNADLTDLPAAVAVQRGPRSLAEFVSSCLGPGTAGFGGPIALAGLMHRDRVDPAAPLKPLGQARRRRRRPGRLAMRAAG